MNSRSSIGISRRGVLRLTVVGVAAGVAGVGVMSTSWFGQRSPAELSVRYLWLAEEFLPVTSDNYYHLSRVASRVLANERDTVAVQQALAKLLHDNFSFTDEEAQRDVMEAVAAMIAEDFSAGRVVLVDRWVLSRTQAVICMSLLT